VPPSLPRDVTHAARQDGDHEPLNGLTKSGLLGAPTSVFADVEKG
jgi:hypothetical protein